MKHENKYGILIGTPLDFLFRPDLIPFACGVDRAQLLGFESAKAFAERKWHEQSIIDRGSQTRKSRARIRQGKRKQGVTLAECPDAFTVCQPATANESGKLSADAEMQTAVYLERWSADKSAVLDVSEAKHG